MATTQINKEHFSALLAKVLAEKWQVDVRLKAVDSDEGSVISAHKAILESRSEVFKKMLKSYELKSSSKQVETITLSEMKQEDLEAFVEFIYSDGSMLSEKVKRHARALYLAADKYKILQLRDVCRSELISSLDMANSLDFLELAQTPFDKVLNDAALNYIKTNDLMIPSVDKFESFIDSYQNLAVEFLEASITRRRCYNCGFIDDHNRTGKSCSNCGFDRPCRS